MSYGGHRGAGERVLEGRHVIGLFLAVILLSGLFFTLGYVMGLHQSEARASADDLPAKPESRSAPKPETVSKRAQKTTPGESPTDTGTPNSSEWEFYHAGEKNKNEDLLKPGPAVPAKQAKSDPVLVKAPAPRSGNAGGSKPSQGFDPPPSPHSAIRKAPDSNPSTGKHPMAASSFEKKLELDTRMADASNCLTL